MMETGPVGIVGLGLLGRGIAASLIASGFEVVACDTAAAQRDAAAAHVTSALSQLQQRGQLSADVSASAAHRLRLVTSTDALADCRFVIESVTESMDVKAGVFDALETCLGKHTPIASNTSALPISLLQRDRQQPSRFVGMHWGEPCHISRFLEVIRGEQTDDATFDATVQLGCACGKEPALVQRDVRGFITNRLMYAMLREALHLLDSGVGDAETIDRAFRNDIGYWATLAGPFRWMDLTGVSAYARVMEDLLPELSDTHAVSATMRRLVDSGAEGVSNGRGFYKYTDAEAAAWMRRWTEFTWAVRELADTYTPTQDEAEG